MVDNARHGRRPRLRTKTLFGASYSWMLPVAFGVLIFAIYMLMPYIPTYFLKSATPPQADIDAASPLEILRALIRVSVASGIPGILLRVSGVILAVLAIVGIASWRAGQPRASARLRLTASYALFLVIAGGVLLVGIYIVLRYVPNYPMVPAHAPGLGRDFELRSEVASRSEVLRALVRVSGIILAILAIVGVFGGWILAGWILRPLQRINEAAQVAATGRLDHRIRLAGRNDEFRQLADTFDHMLDRLHDAFTIQERFAANASHELRTPLTINATLLDVARRHPDQQNYATLIERLSITNARAIGLTEALLRLADANRIMASSEALDLSEIAHDAIHETREEAEQRQVEFEADLETAPTRGDSALLGQLVTNLIQNAIRHNSSPGRAWIATEHDPLRSVVTLRVENTGRRYTPQQVTKFTEPFFRGDGRVRRSEDAKGYGLGLALVARIVAVHGGNLSLTPRPEGGLIVVVTLPSRERTFANQGDQQARRGRLSHAHL